MHFSDVYFSLIIMMMIKMLIYHWSTISIPAVFWPDYLLSLERASLCGFYSLPGTKLQVIHLCLAQLYCTHRSSKIYWPVSGKGVLPAPWLAWITVDRKFVTMGSLHYSDPFFLLFLILLYLGGISSWACWPSCQRSCLVMSFFFPINISTIVLNNSPSQTSWLT